jgi:hypothetical protein
MKEPYRVENFPPSCWSPQGFEAVAEAAEFADRPDDLIVSQTRDYSAIDNLENGSFRLGCRVGGLIVNQGNTVEFIQIEEGNLGVGSLTK